MKKEEDIDKEIEIDINLDEEGNEEIDNIIVDNENNESPEEKKNENKEDKDKKDDDSLSIEGEIDDFYSVKRPHKKKVYENKPNNEYLDLLLSFVMNDKVELNYVLSGYFANVMITLLDNYPSQMIRYLYTQRKDAIRKIIFHSNQKAFAILSLKIINFETFITSNKSTDNTMQELVLNNTNFRNELVGDIIKSINLDGFADEKGEIKTGVDVEGRFGLISDMIDENINIVRYLILNGDVYSHLFNILDTDLYNEKNVDNNNNFNNKYYIYGLFITLITKLLKTAVSKNILDYPTNFSFDCINKEKKFIPFKENIIISFGKILKYNFIPKKPELILGKNSSMPYRGLGILNIEILELVKEMFSFMKKISSQFDKILINNNFCQNSIDYFFEYQWNNIYHINFVEFFNMYLLEEKDHIELTNFYFNNMKLHELLINYLTQDKDKDKVKDKEAILPKQKIKINLKSGKSINSGVYPHVIDLIYKIQSVSGLDIFTKKEKAELNIKNYGEFEFPKDEKSNKFLKLINRSTNINNILKNCQKWDDVTKNIVFPLIKVYEGQLSKKKKEIEVEESNEEIFIKSTLKKKSIGGNDYLLQQLLNVTKKERTPNKRFSLPVSRNEKNVNKTKIEKSSLREKILNKGGYRNINIFEDEDDEKNNDGSNKNNKEKKEENTEKIEDNKDYNDTNYWEVKNSLPENIKKEVDKKTNIIFNYNPITYENNNKNDISEEDELLSIAMGLEHNEKIEKNKKIMYIMPGKLKPINLKAKTNPVQSIFASTSSNNENNDNKEHENNSNNNNDYTKLNSKKNKDKINMFDDSEKKKINDNVKLNTDIGENEENEEEEEGVIKRDEKEEDNIVKEKENNDDKTNKISENEDTKIYNDVNYWGNNKYYLNEKEMEDCLKDL